MELVHCVAIYASGIVFEHPSLCPFFKGKGRNPHFFMGTTIA
jgi:hypothetical protein